MVSKFRGEGSFRNLSKADAESKLDSLLVELSNDKTEKAYGALSDVFRDDFVQITQSSLQDVNALSLDDLEKHEAISSIIDRLIGENEHAALRLFSHPDPKVRTMGGPDITFVGIATTTFESAARLAIHHEELEIFGAAPTAFGGPTISDIVSMESIALEAIRDSAIARKFITHSEGMCPVAFWAVRKHKSAAQEALLDKDLLSTISTNEGHTILDEIIGRYEDIAIEVIRRLDLAEIRDRNGSTAAHFAVKEYVSASWEALKHNSIMLLTDNDDKTVEAIAYETIGQRNLPQAMKDAFRRSGAYTTAEQLDELFDKFKTYGLHIHNVDMQERLGYELRRVSYNLDDIAMVAARHQEDQDVIGIFVPIAQNNIGRRNSGR